MGYLNNAGLSYFFGKLKTIFAPISHGHGGATQSAAGFMSAADKKKLDGIAEGANKYSLPTATSSVLGGVKTGANITNSSGTISITKANVTGALGYTPPTTDTNTWRGVQNNLTSTATDQSLAAAQGKILNESKAAMIVLTNENLNDVKTPGFYSSGGSNTVTNKPSDVDHFGLIVIHRATGNYYTQIIYTDSAAYRRHCVNGTWGGWVQDKLTDTNTWRGIQNVLTSDSTTDSLSAAQGKALKTLVDGKAASGHTHKSVIDNGNGTSTTTFAYSKAGMNYGDYTWLAGWNGYELRAVAKSQFAQAAHTHDDRYYTESEMDTKLAAKADAHSHPYLPTAGGTMGGTAMISWPDSGNYSNKNDGVTFPVKRGGLSWSGQSDGIKLFAEETANDNLELILQFTDDDSNGLTIRNAKGNAVSRLTAAGTFTGKAATAGTADNATTATTASKLGTNAGSATQPVYFANGVPVATTYTLAKSVPADAKFTDTNTWRGVQNNLTSTATDQSLSAAQGKVLKDLVDGKAAASHTHSQYYDSTISRTKGTVLAAPASADGGATFRALTKSDVGLGSVDNTADSAKSVKYATSAGSATKATNDAKDQAITGYIRGLSVSGKTVTYTKGDGTTGTITTQDTNTTYSNMTAATASAAGKAGLVPAPGAGSQAKYLRGDGTWATPTNTTYSAFKGATSSAAGGAGLVPAPGTGNVNQYLKGDGTWGTPSNTWRGIQNNLTSDSTSDSLAAAQGKALKALIDGKAASSHTHNYAGSSSAGGAATSANKVNAALTISLNGTSQGAWDGSSAKSISITAASVGATSVTISRW